MFSHDSDAGVYDLFLADAQGENAQPLAENVGNLLFVSETQLVCVGMRADRPLLLVDLAAGSVQEIEGVDLSNQLLTQCFVADGVYYFYALEAEQDEQGAQGYALDLAARTVQPFSGERRWPTRRPMRLPACPRRSAPSPGSFRSRPIPIQRAARTCARSCAWTWTWARR